VSKNICESDRSSGLGEGWSVGRKRERMWCIKILKTEVCPGVVYRFFVWGAMRASSGKMGRDEANVKILDCTKEHGGDESVRIVSISELEKL